MMLCINTNYLSCQVYREREGSAKEPIGEAEDWGKNRKKEEIILKH